MRKPKITILSSLFLFSMFVGFSARSEVASFGPKRLNLSGDMHDVDKSNSYLIEDSSGNFSIQDLLTEKGQDYFVRFDKQLTYNEHVNSVYWQKIVLQNQSDAQAWLVEFPDLHIGFLELYVVTENGVQVFPETGFEKRFDTRSLFHKNFLFELSVPLKGQITLYAKIKSSRFCGIFTRVRSLKGFANYFLVEYYMLGLYYGIIFILFAYNFFLGLYTKDRLYFFYCAYTISCAFYTFAEDGLGFQWIWGNYPSFNLVLEKAAPVLLLSSFLFYSHCFLDLKENFPKSKVYFLGYFVCYLYTQVFRFEENQLNNFLLAIPFLTTCFIAIQIYRKGHRSARFFVLGNSVIICSLVVFFFRSKGWLPSTVFTVYLFNFGFIFEAIILSISLADKIRITKELKDAAQKEIIHQLQINESLQQNVNRELEEKVKERTKNLIAKTKELETVNTNLEILKKELYAMNSKMDVNIWELKKEVKKEVEARVLNNTISLEEFGSVYTDVYCYQYLRDLKWKNGFLCPKCGNKKAGRGNNNFTYKCTQCQHQESVTSNTLFHAIKFPISKAFYLTYYLHKNGNDVSSEELALQLGLTKNTVWKFSKKVVQAVDAMGKVAKATDAWEKLILTTQEKQT